MNLPQDNEPLREKIVTKLDDYFRYTLEILIDKDVPACADDLLALFQTERTRIKAEVVQAVREGLPKKVATAYSHKMQNLDLAEGRQEWVTSYENNIGYNMALAQVTALLDGMAS